MSTTLLSLTIKYDIPDILSKLDPFLANYLISQSKSSNFRVKQYSYNCNLVFTLSSRYFTTYLNFSSFFRTELIMLQSYSSDIEFWLTLLQKLIRSNMILSSRRSASSILEQVSMTLSMLTRFYLFSNKCSISLLSSNIRTLSPNFPL